MNLTLDNVRKTFGDKVALDIDRYEINSGEIVGLVGNNGAGKTTMFRVILDLLRADAGTATIHGESEAGEPLNFVTSACEDWKDYTGAFVDSGFLIDYLTPEEYFHFIGKICSIPSDELKERIARFDAFMNGEVLGQNKLIRNLSAGNQQKVGIIGAMLNNPKLLILDEPFNFLDPSSQLAIKSLLTTYNKEHGATIIVSSHNLTHTIDICTRVTLLEHGRIIRDYSKDYADMTSEIENYFRTGSIEKVEAGEPEVVKAETEESEN